MSVSPTTQSAPKSATKGPSPLKPETKRKRSAGNNVAVVDKGFDRRAIEYLFAFAAPVVTGTLMLRVLEPTSAFLSEPVTAGRVRRLRDDSPLPAHVLVQPSTVDTVEQLKAAATAALAAPKMQEFLLALSVQRSLLAIVSQTPFLNAIDALADCMSGLLSRRTLVDYVAQQDAYAGPLFIALRVFP